MGTGCGAASNGPIRERFENSLNEYKKIIDFSHAKKGDIYVNLIHYDKNLKNEENFEYYRYFSVNLIHNKNQLKPSDNNFKIYFLIFFAAYFDFIRSFSDIFYLSKNIPISPTLSDRLGCIYTIGCALICKYALNFKIGKYIFN